VRHPGINGLFSLQKMYRDGIGVYKDEKKAAEQGNVDTQKNLGL